MRIKKLIACVTIIAIMMSITVSSLAAQSTSYSSSGITHRFDTSPITKNSGNWASIYDRNTSITFQNSSLEQYQKSLVIIYVSGTARLASGEKTVPTGTSIRSIISAGYTGNTYLYLRIRNPYHGQSNESPMTTRGAFEGFLG